MKTFTPPEAAVIADVPLATVQKAITTKQLPVAEGGGQRRRIDEPSVLALALTRVTPRNVNLSLIEARALLIGADTTRADSPGSGEDLDLAKLLVEPRRKMALLARARTLVESRSGRRAATIKGTKIAVDDLVASIQGGMAPESVAATYPALDRETLEAIRLWAAANPARGRPPRGEVMAVGPTPALTSVWRRAVPVTARQIDEWASGKRQAQGELPILIRKLLHAGGGLAAASMPGGDSIFMPGWDGVVELTGATPWAPSGRTAWEVSCESNPGSKATRDYDKRTSDTPEAERLKTTLVLVTARRWPGKKDWLKTKQGEGAWLRVRAYDADDLEQWLEHYTAVAIWFTDLMGLTGHGVASLRAFWTDWAAQSKPIVTSVALFAGREQQCTHLVELIRKRLADNIAKSIGVRADSTGEAAAFIAATLLLQPDLDSGALAVTSTEGWRFVEQNPMVRLAIAASPDIAERLPQRPSLTVLIPFAAGDMAGQYRGAAARGGADEITLDRPDAQTFEKALTGIGMDEADAKRLAVSTGRSWSVFCRRTSSNPALREPAWLHDEHTQALSTICLLGSWSSGNEADRKIVAHLAGRSFEDIERDLNWLARLDDAPVIKIGETWKAKSPLELLDLFGSRITRDELDRFFSIARELLTGPDPVLELPEEERYAAAIHGKVRPQSGLLFQAVCDTLIKLAVRGPSTGLNQVNIEARVEAFVRNLLHDADGVRWLSLASELPALAEAAPSAFLNAIDDSLKLPDAPVTRLLKETSGSGFTGRCWHAGLLWALELLAWAPERLARVSLILAALSHVEIKGNWGNSPKRSLLGIFRSWFPQTSATVQQRIQVIDTLIQREPDIAAELLNQLASISYDVANPAYRPVWRDDDAGAGYGASGIERQEMLVASADRQISLAKGHPDRVVKLIAKADSLDHARFIRVVTLAEDFADPSYRDEDREMLRNALRERIHWHKNYGDSDKDGFQGLGELERLYQLLEPKDVILCHRWLFDSDWPHLPVRYRQDDFKEREKQIIRSYDQAINAIFAAEGLAGVRRLAGLTKGTGQVGAALSRMNLEEGEVISWLITEASDLTVVDPISGVLLGILRGQDEARSRTMLEQVFEKAQAAGWSHDQLARLLTLARDEKFTWDLASRSEAVEKSYWNQCRPGLWIRTNSTDFEYCLRRLMSAGRPRSALQLCHLDMKKVDPHLIFEMLEGLLKGNETDGPLDMWGIREAVKALEQSKTIDQLPMARLEFGLMPLFGLDANECATTLYTAITSQPNLFVELVTILYKPETGESAPANESHKTAANNAWQVLHQCRRIPGIQPDGSIDSKAFIEFIEKSRELCREASRMKVCDVTLGEILAHAPADADGKWPCGPVRDLLDRTELDNMRRGFRTGVFNKRGVFSKAYGEGGPQERALAQTFRSHAQAMHNSHVHLAATLEDIAKGYEADAVRADVDAKLRVEGH